MKKWYMIYKNWYINEKLIYTGEYDADIPWYIPGLLQLMFQGMLDRIDTIEQPAHISYEDKETFDF